MEVEPSLRKNLNGLENLRFVGGSISITGNRSLTDIRGLVKVERIGKNLSIVKNQMLPGCEAESLRREIGIGKIGRDVIIATT